MDALHYAPTHRALARGAKALGTRHYYRRSDLFLLRMWSEEAADGSGKVEWHGKVQRVTDGEAHQFREWQDLLDLLLAMLSNDRRTTPGDSVLE
jgi:predicted esterase YcpF (UPF0227 family)